MKHFCLLSGPGTFMLLHDPLEAINGFSP
jgi:hypothetical protein